MSSQEIPQASDAETETKVDFRIAFMQTWARMRQYTDAYKELVTDTGDHSDPDNGIRARAFRLNDNDAPVIMINLGESAKQGAYTPQSIASILMPNNKTLADSVAPDGTEKAAESGHSKATLLCSTLHIVPDGSLFVNRHWKFEDPTNPDDSQILESGEYSDGVPSEHELSFAVMALTAAADGNIHPGARTEDLLVYDAHYVDWGPVEQQVAAA